MIPSPEILKILHAVLRKAMCLQQSTLLACYNPVILIFKFQ